MKIRKRDRDRKARYKRSERVHAKRKIKESLSAQVHASSARRRRIRSGGHWREEAKRREGGGKQNQEKNIRD